MPIAIAWRHREWYAEHFILNGSVGERKGDGKRQKEKDVFRERVHNMGTGNVYRFLLYRLGGTLSEKVSTSLRNGHNEKSRNIHR